MKNIDNKRQQKESGFTLLELLLVIGLTTSLIIGFGRLSTIWANQQIAELSGIHMARVTDTVENYIRTERPAAGGDITADIAANLPTGMTMRSPLRRDVAVELRVAGNEYQAVIYTDGDVIVHDKLMQSARAAGSAGGYVTNITSPANIAESAFGLWTTDLTADFAGLAPTVNNDGGQLVSYLSFSLEEVFGAYLYREDMGDADLNTMFTDLNMNGYAIRSAASVEANDMDVYNTATIGQLQVDGDTTFAGSVDISDTLDVGDQMVVDGDLTVANGDVLIEGGDINAAGVNVDTLNASIINAPDIAATSITINGADSVLTTDISISGEVFIDGEVQANTLNANQLTATNVDTNQMTVNDNITIDGNAEITGSAVMDVIAVDDCFTIDPDGLDERYGPNCPP